MLLCHVRQARPASLYTPPGRRSSRRAISQQRRREMQDRRRDDEDAKGDAKGEAKRRRARLRAAGGQVKEASTSAGDNEGKVRGAANAKAKFIIDRRGRKRPRTGRIASCSKRREKERASARARDNGAQEEERERTARGRRRASGEEEGGGGGGPRGLDVCAHHLPQQVSLVGKGGRNAVAVSCPVLSCLALSCPVSSRLSLSLAVGVPACREQALIEHLQALALHLVVPWALAPAAARGARVARPQQLPVATPAPH